MIEKIQKAIKERVVIQFLYEEKTQTVEPYVLGYKKDSDVLLLLGYRIINAEEEIPWKFFVVKNIHEVTLINLKAYSYRGSIARYINLIKPLFS